MEDMTGRSTRGYEGATCSFFLEKKKEPKNQRTKEKSIGCSPEWVTFARVRGYGFLYTRGGACMLL